VSVKSFVVSILYKGRVIHNPMSGVPLRTPLYPWHQREGARFFLFGEWEMPLVYSSILKEHEAVRRAAGLFDVSHMGKFLIRGSGSHALLDRLSSNAIPRRPGRARYTHILDEDGHILDDVIITCLEETAYLCVCNAARRSLILGWIRRHATGQDIVDLTFDVLCLALQGPRAAALLQSLTSIDIDTVRPFRATVLDLLLGDRPGTARGPSGDVPPETKGSPSPLTAWAGADDRGDACLATRTGYTGEDGFELFPSTTMGQVLWSTLLARGADLGLKPAGLGARDTLRLEKGYLLSGQDFDGSQTPLEVGAERIVRWDHDFLGRDALQRQQMRGDYPRLVGLVLQAPGVPRHGYEIVFEDKVVGRVTSGALSPTLGRGIALGYVPPSLAKAGTIVAIRIRRRDVPASITQPPFL
jgi:aminomethyltransferase